MEKGKQLHLKFTKNLEDIPDYSKKLKAYEYLRNPNRDKIFRDYLYAATLDKNAEMPEKLPRAYYHKINGEMGFPMAREYRGMTVIDTTDIISDYCKDILDKDGEILPSKEQNKAA
jgi:hypothetical protein